MTKQLFIQEVTRRINRFDHPVGWNIYYGGKFMEYFNLGDARSIDEARQLAEQNIDNYEARLNEPTEQTDPRQQVWE